MSTKKLVKKYGNKINIACCGHKHKKFASYHIGYIGLPICTIAICKDCGERQILCGKIGKFFLKKFIKRGITRCNIIGQITSNDIFVHKVGV